MNRFSQSTSLLVLSFAFLTFAVGCGSSGNTVVEQDPESSLSTEEGVKEYEELMAEKGEGI